MEVEDLRAALEEVVTRLQVSENKLDVLARMQAGEEDTARALSDGSKHFDDIVTTIENGDQIQLESYRSIPEFSGEKSMYQSWRSQVVRRMQMIDRYKTHPKYEAALGIIRARITGAASDALTNNKTAYNIDAIIDRLDASYADQRPLYITEAEMTSIKQYGKTLQEYHDSINQALNLVISKIILTYKNTDEQRALISQAQLKAIRTFIIGLKSYAMRNVLYGGKYRTLANVYAVAQTVYYDNQYLEMDRNCDTRREKQTPLKGFYPGTQHNKIPTKFTVNQNCNPPQPIHKSEPMDIDSSNRIKINNNWRQPQMNTPQKRDYNSSRQYTTQPNKMQRINQLQESESNSPEGYDGDVCDEIPDDLISHTSNTSLKSDNASAFLLD